MKIDYAEVLVIGPAAERLTWAEDLPAQYMTTTLLRLVTDDGCEGVAGVCSYSAVDFDRSVAETLRHYLPVLIGADPHAREAILARLRPRALPMVPSALSAVDIALWDWAGKQVGLPIYQMLGGARSRILSYASTPLLPSIKAYIDLIAELRAQGFRAVKLHTWCVLERDLALVQAVRGAYPDLTLMLDVENNYDRMAALRMARVLAELNFHWFEAPLPDFDLEGYCAIRAQAAVPLLPAGNWILDPHGIRRGLSMGAWDAARTDTAVCGGISAAKDVFAIAHSFGTTCELQAWGHTLSQAANLQVALGLSACTFFEQPVPYAPFEYGMGTVIRTEPDGYVSAPPGPGLGVEIDWPAMKAATVYRFSSRDPLL